MRQQLRAYLIVGLSILAVAAIVIAIRMVLVQAFDSAIQPPYTVNSRTYNDPSIRLQELRRHWSEIKSPAQDAVYMLHIYPGFGPTVVEYTIGVKVDQKYIDNWLDNCEPSEESATNNLNDFKEISIPWRHSSASKDYFTATGDHILVFRKEGIILLQGQD